MHLFQNLPLALFFSSNTFLVCILISELGTILAWWHSSSHCLCRSSIRSLRTEISSALIYADRDSFSRERCARSSVHPSTAFSNSLKEVHKEKKTSLLTNKQKKIECGDDEKRWTFLSHWINVISEQTHHLDYFCPTKRKRIHQPHMFHYFQAQQSMIHQLCNK